MVLTKEDKREIIGTVLYIATKALFNNHYYAFDGKMFRQNGGGPIGLRGTCALARLCMQIFDVKWEQVLRDICITIWLNTRYMDDGRTCLPPLKPGWRLVDKQLMYSIAWEKEDQELTDSEITKRGLVGTLRGVEDFLDFTIETVDDFEDKWLPTLDTSLQVDRKNKVQYKFYEKPMCSNVTVQKRSAMGEDAKVQVVSNDLVRRLLNNSEELGAGSKVEIVDNYSQKLSNSGYRGEQLKRIILNGIKGYEGKVRRCRNNGRKLHRSSIDSLGERIRKKLVGKSNWFRKRKKSNMYGGANKPGGTSEQKNKNFKEPSVRTVLFVDQSPGGELARRIKEQLRTMEPTLGFKTKVVERTGQTLGSKFPLASLWDGSPCGRGDCVTCTQGLEEIPPCTRNSLLYENICLKCNPGARNRSKEEIELVRDDIPTIYVGETSRSIQERSKEHWGGVRSRNQNNHMVKHMAMEHNGEEPLFAMKLVRQFKTALARQVSEAVRIRRRGGEGAILNSRGEFNRSHIPRLRVEEKESEGSKMANKKEKEQFRKKLKEQDEAWERERAGELGASALLGPTSSPTKRNYDIGEEQGAPNKRRRKLKYGVMGLDWGEEGEKEAEIRDLNNTCGELLPTPGSCPVPEKELIQSSITNYLDRTIPAESADSPTLDDPVARAETTQVEESADSPTLDDPAARGETTRVEESADSPTLENPAARGETTQIDEGDIDTIKASKPEGIQKTVTECNFKRGGMCVTHNVKGSKIPGSRKAWAKRKDGTFGWIYKKTIKYVCSLAEKGSVSNSEKIQSDNRGSALQGEWDNIQNGVASEISECSIRPNLGISERGIPGAGAKKESENVEIMREGSD